MAFKTAARIAFKKGCVDASPVLLEPIYCMWRSIVPDEYMGDIIGDMNKRRGRIMGMDQVDGMQLRGRRGAAGRDVQVRHRPALDDAGARLASPCSSSATRKCRLPTWPRRSSRTRRRTKKKRIDSQSHKLIVSGAPHNPALCGALLLIVRWANLKRKGKREHDYHRLPEPIL